MGAVDSDTRGQTENDVHMAAFDQMDPLFHCWAATIIWLHWVQIDRWRTTKPSGQLSFMTSEHGIHKDRLAQWTHLWQHSMVGYYAWHSSFSKVLISNISYMLDSNDKTLPSLGYSCSLRKLLIKLSVLLLL